MKDARMQWKILRMEWKAIFILPYQFHTRFRALYLQKITYGFWVETNNIVTQKYSTSIFTGIICRLIAVVWLCIMGRRLQNYNLFCNTSFLS